MSLLNCWEINKCKHGAKALLEDATKKCIAAVESFGHSCWAIEGTLCKEKQETPEGKKCEDCKVFRTFNALKGLPAEEFDRIYEEERKRYHALARRWTKMNH